MSLILTLEGYRSCAARRRSLRFAVAKHTMSVAYPLGMLVPAKRDRHKRIGPQGGGEPPLLAGMLYDPGSQGGLYTKIQLEL